MPIRPDIQAQVDAEERKLTREITLRVKRVQVVSTRGADQVSLTLDLATPYPQLEPLEDPMAVISTAHGYGETWCREVLGVTPDEVTAIPTTASKFSRPTAAISTDTRLDEKFKVRATGLEGEALLDSVRSGPAWEVQKLLLSGTGLTEAQATKELQAALAVMPVSAVAEPVEGGALVPWVKRLAETIPFNMILHVAARIRSKYINPVKPAWPIRRR